MQIININPSIIYFTHSKIRNQFTGCGRRVLDTYFQLKSNPGLIKDIPKIKVMYDKENNKYISMNNRRLWVFKKLYHENLISEVPVYILPLENSKRDRKMRENQYSLIAKIKD